MSKTALTHASLAVIPMGTPTSVGPYIAECQKVLEKMKADGIKYEVSERSGDGRSV